MASSLQALVGWRAEKPTAQIKSERREKEVGALDNKIERHKPNPDAPAQNLEHRYLDRSSPLTLRIIDPPGISKSTANLKDAVALATKPANLTTLGQMSVPPCRSVWVSAE